MSETLDYIQDKKLDMGVSKILLDKGLDDFMSSLLSQNKIVKETYDWFAHEWHIWKFSNL